MEIHRILNPPRDSRPTAGAPSSRAHDPYGAWCGALHAWLGALAPDVAALLGSRLLSPAQDEHARRLLAALQARIPVSPAPGAADAHLRAVLDAGNALFRQGGFLSMPEGIRVRYTALASRFSEGAELRQRLADVLARYPGTLTEHTWQ